MIDIDKEAVAQLREYRERRGPASCVRIGILSGSSQGPMLGISIDESSDRDEVFSYEDLEVIVDKALLEYCEKMTVEFVMQEGEGCGAGGFKITPKNPV